MNALENPPIHVLQVEVRDAWRVFAGQSHRVDACVGRMPCVDTEIKRRRVGLSEKSVDLVRELDVRSGVRMKDRLQAELAGEASNVIHQLDKLAPGGRAKSRRRSGS